MAAVQSGGAHAAAPAAMQSPSPASAPAASARKEERVRMTRLRQTVAKRLKSAQENAALLRSEEHTSELQSLMRISYAVFCLKQKNKNKQHGQHQHKPTH